MNTGLYVQKALRKHFATIVAWGTIDVVKAFSC